MLLPIRDTYRVADGLLAGAYPGSHDPAGARRRLRAFHEHGITLFVDLTHPADWGTVLKLVAVLVFTIATINLLGWPVNGALLFAGSAWALGSRTPIKDLLIGAVLSVTSWYAFYVGLGIPLSAVVPALTVRPRLQRPLLLTFMDECVYPAEAVYHRQLAESDDPHFFPPVMARVHREDARVVAVDFVNVPSWAHRP